MSENLVNGQVIWLGRLVSNRAGLFIIDWPRRSCLVMLVREGVYPVFKSYVHRLIECQ